MAGSQAVAKERWQRRRKRKSPMADNNDWQDIMASGFKGFDFPPNRKWFTLEVDKSQMPWWSRIKVWWWLRRFELLDGWCYEMFESAVPVKPSNQKITIDSERFDY